MKTHCSLYSLAPLLLLVTSAHAETTVLLGGTLIDVANRGRSTADIENAYVLIDNGIIHEIGRAAEYKPQEEATVIDTTGTFIVPGLVDGFATMNDQSYANAFLHEGVTSIIGVDGGRRGIIDLTTSPRPFIYDLESVGYEPATTSELLADLERIHDEGSQLALLMYRIEPEQLPVLVNRARELGMGTIGELAASTYARGAQAGIDAFVHTTRYSLDMASDAMRRGVLAEPFSDDLESDKWKYYLWLAERTPTDTVVQQQARRFGAGNVALMPTLALLYLDHPFAQNPWDEPISKILAPGKINNPANRITGRHVHDQHHLDAYAKVARAELRLDRAFLEAGTMYLAGSATDVWGTMPGISLHTELELLVRIGMTPREALAAATSNFADTFRWKNVGALKPGRRADILVLDADPRVDVAHLKRIRTVMLAGKVLDRTALSQPESYTDAPNGTLLDREAVELPSEFFGVDGTLLLMYRHLDKVTVERITYASDGLRVMGFLISPTAPGPHPCIIHNRGGNRDFGEISLRRVARLHSQIASWGYVVVASQYRGVAGGDGMEQFGGDDVNDVLNLMPLLDTLPNADTSRLGMAGGSRGGMMTYLALTRTDRIDAAVIRCGVADLTDWGSERPEMMSVFNDLIPEFDPDDSMSMASRSIVHNIAALDRTAPILIMQGTADWRVNPESSLRLSWRLLEHKHPFRLIMFEGADHSLSEFYDEFLQHTRDWFDRYVRDGDPLPNTEPHGR